MAYNLLKITHIGSILLWIGPALGAWLVLKAVERPATYTDRTAARVSRTFFTLITLEHLAFCVLLITGITLALIANMWQAPWLHDKLLVVGLVIIPLELLDIWLGNWKVARISRKLYAGSTASPQELRLVALYHGAFTKLALVLIPSSVLLVMWLAVSKTGLG